MINLSSFIRYQARRRPDETALVCGEVRVTYIEFYQRILAMAGWLHAQGVSEGDVVAVLMKNSTTFLDIAFATSHIGAVLLPINFRLAADEVSYIVNDARAKLLLADDELMDRATGCDRVE